MTQLTTDIKVADDGNHAEDVVEGMDKLTVETRDGVLMTPTTVAWMEANDVDDGFLKYLACGITSKPDNDKDKDNDTYGFQKDTESEETRRKLARTLSFDKAMKRQVNTGGKPIPKEAATITITTTEKTGEAAGKQGQYRNRTPPPRPPKPLTHKLRGGQKPSSLSSTVNPNAYDFTHPQRGYMVLIVNDMFFRQNPRDGAHWDMLKSKEIARKLGFRIMNRNKEKNLKKAEMIRVLREAQAMDYSDSDCFALVISTHGLEYPNPRVNGKLDHALICSDDEMIFTSTIIEMFSDKQCPTLKNKPRLFFIQACRGDNLDNGADVSVAHHRKVEDRTCGVTGPDTTSRRRYPDRESVDEQDTQPWDDTSYGLPGADHDTPNSQLKFETLNSGFNPTVNKPAGFSSGSGKVVDNKVKGSYAAEHNIPFIDDPPSSRGYISSTGSEHHAGSRNTSIRSKFVPKDPVLPIRPRKERSLSAGIVGSHNLHKATVQHAPSDTVHKIYAPRPYPIVDTPSLKCDNDFLVMYAIPPGMFAWRNTSDGSWMIDYLHKVIMAYNMAARPSNLLSLLTKVSAMMSHRETNTPSTPSMHQKKAVSVIEHKLTKDVIFTPKAAMSHWVR